MLFFPHFRHHTLAYVPSSGVVYAFGCNSHGQLGTGMLGDARSPIPVKASFLTGIFHSTGKASQGKIICIAPFSYKASQNASHNTSEHTNGGMWAE